MKIRTQKEILEKLNSLEDKRKINLKLNNRDYPSYKYKIIALRWVLKEIDIL
jgi:hypothetical protein